MGRWQPDARGRLMTSALELFAENGFEQTTALEIAQRAGVTERTFFRYFADKREVLFDRSGDLVSHVVASIASAPADHAPIDVVGAAMTTAAALLEGNREYARRRRDVVAANPSLQERELLKMFTLAAAASAALRERGATPLAADLAAETGTTVFRIGFEAWVDGGPTVHFADCIREALAQLRELTTEASRDAR